MSLCNISVHESNQEKLAHLGSLPALIHLLADQEEVVARYAAMALTNLSTEGKNQVYIAKLGALQKLITLASTQDTEASRYSGTKHSLIVFFFLFSGLYI
jgi:HEAT repeat protein